MYRNAGIYQYSGSITSLSEITYEKSRNRTCGRTHLAQLLYKYHDVSEVPTQCHKCVSMCRILLTLLEIQNVSFSFTKISLLFILSILSILSILFLLFILLILLIPFILFTLSILFIQELQLLSTYFRNPLLEFLFSIAIARVDSQLVERSSLSIIHRRSKACFWSVQMRAITNDSSARSYRRQSCWLSSATPRL